MNVCEVKNLNLVLDFFSLFSQSGHHSTTLDFFLLEICEGIRVLLIENSLNSNQPTTASNRTFSLPLANFDAVLGEIIHHHGRIVNLFTFNECDMCHITGPEGFEVYGFRQNSTVQSTAMALTILQYRASKSRSELLGSDQSSNLRADLASDGRDLAPTTSITVPPPSSLSAQFASSDWSPPKGQLIPTIFPYIFHNNMYRLIAPNSERAVPFETDLFSGFVLLMVNSDELQNPFRQRFVGPSSKYRFEVQVQGKFKSIPKGRLFMGAEITKKMELGMLGRAMCGTILQIGRRVNGFMHHSFGDKNNFELPHIMSPMWSTIDRMVVTSCGENPPPLGPPLPENAAFRDARRKQADFQLTVDLNSIYSFSFKTSNLDVVNWNVVNIPLMSNLDLHSFWADAAIRLCAYCVPDDKVAITETSTGGLPKYHPQSCLQYCFALEIKHSSNHPELIRTIDPDQYFSTDSRLQLSACEPNYRTEAGTGSDLCSSSVIVKDGKDDIEDSRSSQEYFDAFDGPAELDSDEELLSQQRGTSAIGDRDSFSSEDEDVGRASFFVSPTNSTIAVHGSSQIERNAGKFSTNEEGISLMRDVELEQDSHHVSVGPTVQREILVIAAIEVDEMRRSRQRGRRTLYAFSLSSNQGDGRPVTLRTYKEWLADFPLLELPFRPAKWPRLNEIDQRRLELDFSFSEINASRDESMVSRLKSFMSSDVHTSTFLTKAPGGVSSSRLRTGLPQFFMSSLVCVQLGNYFWSEEFMGLSEDELIFIKPSSRLGVNKRLRLPLNSLTGVRAVNPSETPFMLLGVFCIVVSTFSKQYTILIRNQDVTETWVDTLDCIINTRQLQMLHSLSPPNSVVKSTPRHLDLLIKPKGWKLGDKLVLNARSFTVNSHFFLTSADNPFACYLNSPVLLVESLLRLAFQLAAGDVGGGSQSFGSSPRDTLSSSKDRETFPSERDSGPEISGDLEEMSMEMQSLWTDFMDGISLLQGINLNEFALSENESICLFLNLYHCIILHSFLVVGVPLSVYKWSSFFSVCSYEMFGDVVSLVELEHNVIKAGLPKPAVGIISQAFIPQSRFDFALNCDDFRLHWGVNCGSKSFLSVVPIFEPALLSKQLDCVLRLSLPHQLSVNGSVVTLPQICQWHLKSFDKKQGILNQLLPHCRGEQEMAVCGLLAKRSSITYKYTSMDYRCRIFQALTECVDDDIDT